MAEESNAAKGQQGEQIDNESIERIARRMGHPEVRPGHEKQAVVFQNNRARHGKHIKHKRASNRCSECGSVAQGMPCFNLGIPVYSAKTGH